MAIVTNKKDLNNLRTSGRILVQVLEEVAAHVRPGITTEELDVIAERETRKNGGKPAFKGYKPGSASEAFPASICISLNEEIVHGVPSSKKVYAGDIISLDFGVNYEGMYTDCAFTMPVGEVDPSTMILLKTTYKSLVAGIAQAKLGNTTGDIGHAVSAVANKKKYGVVRSLIGHGVGYAVHEEPQVPNYGSKGTGAHLEENLVIAIEPMFTEGSHEVKLLPDGWTFATADESLSAHFEQTVRITPKGNEIITPFSKKILAYARLSD